MREEISGGEMNRLHLARTVKKGGHLLLLDMPHRIKYRKLTTG